LERSSAPFCFWLCSSETNGSDPPRRGWCKYISIYTKIQTIDTQSSK
jgi:hypothetical protein